MSNNLRGVLELEHRDDYTYLTYCGSEFIITNLQPEHGPYRYSYSSYGYDDYRHCGLKLDLYAVPPEPAKPEYRPVKRSWAKTFGLRKPS